MKTLARILSCSSLLLPALFMACSASPSGNNGDGSLSGGSSSGGNTGNGASSFGGEDQGSGGQTSASGGSDSGSGGDSSVDSCTPGTGTQDNGESITDLETCLTFTKSPSPTDLNGPNAEGYCEGLSLEGFDDWRVPRPEELISYIDSGEFSSTTQFTTGPVYIQSGGDPSFDCDNKSHVCYIAQWNPGSFTPAWNGQGTTSKVYCVRGTAAEGSLDSQYEATNWGACKTGIDGGFVETDCRQ